MQHKKALILLMISIFVFVSNLLLVGAQDDVATISVQPDVQQATTGQEFTVTINVTNANQVYGASFKLAFDPQTFEVVPAEDAAVTPGAFFEGKPGFALKNAVNAESGSIDYAMTLMQPAEPVSGDGVLGTVTFRALKDATTDVTAIEASLVSPEFTEVDGQMIAQRIVEVPAQISQSAPVAAPVVSVNSNTASVSVGASASASASSDATAMFNNPALNSKPAAVQQIEPTSGFGNQIPLIAAGAFFVVGLVLLTLSVGMYSRMRVRFNLMAMNDIQPEQVY